LIDLKADVSVSIDGPPEINDQRRPTKTGQPSTELVIEGLKRLSANKEKIGKLMVTTVVGDMDLVRSYEFLSQFPFNKIQFDFDVLEKSAKVSRAFADQLECIAAIAFNKGGEAELRKIHNFANTFETLDHQIKVKNYCQSGKTYFSIDARNNV